MHSHCPHCGLQYEREPGFFWGAMYITYAFTVGLFGLVSGLLWNVFGNPDTWVYILALAATAAITAPFQIRYGRTGMLYIFGSVKFDRERYEAPPGQPREQLDNSAN